MPKEGGKDFEDLVALAVVPRRVEVQTFDRATDAPVKHVVRVAPMTLDVCGRIAAAVRPIVAAIGVQITLDDLPIIAAEHSGALRELVAAATEQTEEFVGALPLDQFLLLATAVFDVNHDFFVRQVGPIAQALKARMFDGDGPTLSTSSPSTATATP